jgi:pimeloyl-ACP methyl ester carboxylesterase
MSATSAHWAPVAELVRRWASVVAPDLPGFGNTPLAGRGGPAGARRALEAVVDAVAPSEPVVLLATSMGSAVAAGLAAHAPDKVAGLAIGSGYLPAYFGGWRAPAVVAGLVASQVGNLGRGVVGSALRSALEVEPATAALAGADTIPRWSGVRRPSSAERRWASVRLVVPLASMAAVATLGRRLYGRISCPVLLLHGADDPLVPVGWANRVAQERGWELHVLPAVAHVVKLASPGWWLDELGDWLVRHHLVDATLFEPTRTALATGLRTRSPDSARWRSW